MNLPSLIISSKEVKEKLLRPGYRISNLQNNGKRKQKPFSSSSEINTRSNNLFGQKNKLINYDYNV